MPNKFTFSSLTSRILTLNLAALCLVLLGVVYIENFHSNLLKNKFDAMQNQAQLISEVVQYLNLDVDKALLKELAGDARLCIYDLKGQIIFDTGKFYKPVERTRLKNLLNGQSSFWQDSDNKKILNVALPILKQKQVIAVLQLTDFSNDIDKMAHIVNSKLLLFALFISTIFALLSLYLAYTIATPLHRLNEAAKKASLFKTPPTIIPRFKHRYDEIDSLAKAMERMLQAFYGRLELMESFAQDVSHELKNPLASITSASQSLKLSNSEEQRKILEDIIIAEIEHMDLLISDIADASRIDAELARDSYSYIDIEKMLKDRIASAKNLTKNIKFSLVNHAKAKLIVQGNAVRLAQIFDNVLSNAISFKPTIIKTILNEVKGKVEISIEDDGPGIKVYPIDKIFERFYTQRDIKSEVSSNSGLGLAIAKQIIEAHKGSIKAENLKQGARFIIKLPKI